MKMLNLNELKKYLDSNYRKHYEGFENIKFPDEIDGFCNFCNKDVYFKIQTKAHSNNSRGYFPDLDLVDFYSLFVSCPRCQKKSFIHYLKLEIVYYFDPFGEQMDIDFNIDDEDLESEENFSTKSKYFLYELLNIPTQEINYSLEDIPPKYPSLIESTSEAMFCMNHKKNIAAVVMFRRALQIIVKEILGGEGKTLYAQLNWLKANSNNLGIDLNEMFHDNSQLIKDVGNQGAHPDSDEELITFSESDVLKLHDLFLVIVTEIFIKPEKIRKITEELKANRKLK